MVLIKGIFAVILSFEATLSGKRLMTTRGGGGGRLHFSRGLAPGRKGCHSDGGVSWRKVVLNCILRTVKKKQRLTSKVNLQDKCTGTSSRDTGGGGRASG